jgi:hypothetical protein
MPDEWTEADDVVEEVREIRRRIWARFDNDPEKVIDYYLELDKRRLEPGIDTRKPSNKGKSAA